VLYYSQKKMKILFASIPADGHFNPLTGLAVHLRERGHDVRWYTGPSYGSKLSALRVPHFPFIRAKDVNGENLTEHYPEYAKLGVGPKAIAFALEKVFFVNLEGHLHDVGELRQAFPFEAVVFDGAFYAGRLVAEKFDVPAYPIWPGPTPAPLSKTAPPPFFGLKPMAGPLGRLRDALVLKLLAGSTKNGMKIWHELRAREGLPEWKGSLFDLHNETSRAMFMVGSPGMDFPREDWPKNLEFVGPLVAHARKESSLGEELPAALAQKLERHAGKVVVVSQGTIDNRDPEKLFVPTLTALAASEYLVVATTGGRHTDQLRRRFPQENAVIEDFIAYGALMPRAGLFVSNGGYGSVLQALANGVPLLLAGKLEAKNDINARLDYRGLGIDLRTERPTPTQIQRGVERIFSEPSYRENVKRLSNELAGYDPFGIIERRILDGRSAAG
jgi:UDP:flavonoid glycosyltransferase YjiC (YdhE family)